MPPLTNVQVFKDIAGTWSAPGRPGAPNPPPPQSDIHEASDFAAANQSCFWLPSGYVGLGSGTTLFRMVAHTSTHAAEINALTNPATNPYRLIKVGSLSSGSRPSGIEVSGFTLQGTPQGSNYGGLNLLYSTGINVHDVVVTGIPGSSSSPPGETFSMGLFHCDSPTFSDIILDGRDATGTAVAASLSGLNYLATGATFNRVQHNYAKYGFGMAAFQLQGTTPFVWNNCTFTNSRANLNIEDMQTNAPLIFNSCTFGPTQTGQGDIAQVSSKGFSAHVVFNDPILTGGLTYPIKVRWYPTQTGGTQVPTDIQMFIGGVEVTNDPTKFKLVHY